MKGNYDNVAPFYDLLSRVVYGNAILESEIFLVHAIPENSSVLVVGGGTGKVLEEISKKYRGGLKITYVDISKKMTAIARKRKTGDNRIIFVNQSISDTIFSQQFDVVITSFLFDNFSYNTAKAIFNKIDAFLGPDGVWLIADFQLTEKNNLWQKLLLSTMYCFFKVLCGIEASRLPCTNTLFENNGYHAVCRKTFYKNFIYAAIYTRADY